MKNLKFTSLLIIVLLPFCSGKGDGFIKSPGIIEGDVISIKSKVPAKVVDILFDEGDMVRSGKTVVKLDSRIVENQLKDLDLRLKEIGLNLLKMKKKIVQVGANRKYLEDQTAKIDRLSKKKSVSGDALERIKLKLLDAVTGEFELSKNIDVLKLQTSILKNKRANLNLIMEDYSVVSPVSGYILEKFISKGENVFPGMAIADILDIDSLYVEVFLEEKELSRIVIGQKAKIVVDGLEQKDLEGVISFIGKKAEFSPKYVISEKERKALLFRVKISLRDNLEVYKTGMPVTVLIMKKNR